MRTRNEIKNICNGMVEDFITGWKDITILELSYSEYLKYERMVNKILRKYTSTLNVSEDKTNKTISFYLDNNCPFNIAGCLFNAMHKSNKYFGRMSIKKFKFTKLAFLNNLKKRKEWLDDINSLRKAGKLEKVKHSDEIIRIKEALEI